MAMVMRAGAVLGMALVLAGQALAYDTPEALIKAIYAPLLEGRMGAEDMSWFSAETRAEWEAYLEAEPYGLGFSPIVDGQDFDLANFEMGLPQPGGGVTEIPVTFENFGAPRALVYVLVEEPGGWAVHDIEGTHGDDAWSVRDMLAGGPGS